jgi:hypothetical protein
VENDPIEELLLRAYPNPERKGCPGSEVIRSLANKAVSPDDPAWQHIWKCSPCFAEFRDLRDSRRRSERAVRRKRNIYWAAAAAIILICIGAALAALLLNRQKPVPQPGPIAETAKEAPPYPAAVLNLEGVSTTRSAEKNTSTGPVQIQTLPRRIVDLTVYLPRGSEDGQYQLEFLSARDEVLLSSTARAVITRGLTEFSMLLDLTKIAPGTYTVRSRRLPHGTWRMSSVTVQ